jgi:hypothetical protein
MVCYLAKAAKLLISLAAMAVVCTVAWDAFVNGQLYDCTDGGSLDFWFMGDWVHHAVPVAHVVAGRPMSEPDTIKAGWSLSGLWCLWGGFAAVSVGVSFVFASFSWVPKISRLADWVYERTHPA